MNDYTRTILTRERERLEAERDNLTDRLDETRVSILEWEEQLAYAEARLLEIVSDLEAK